MGMTANERGLENQHAGMTRRASRRSYVGDVILRTTSVKNKRVRSIRSIDHSPRQILLHASRRAYRMLSRPRHAERTRTRPLTISMTCGAFP